MHVCSGFSSASVFRSAVLISLIVAGLSGADNSRADALSDYVVKPDTNYSWRVDNAAEVGEFRVVSLSMTSQNWREGLWTHQILIVEPPKVRNPDIAFLFITGDGKGEKYLDLLKKLSSEAGAVAAVVNRVPNQPLYDGRKEDALIAHTFKKYMETGDETWPLLFPMAKSAVRAMDTVAEQTKKSHGRDVTRFVVSGASKRGWTTWLTGAVDPRVKGIAPMVIDMPNMKRQLDWAKRAWGEQSDQIHDYTELKLHERMDQPAMVKLRSWVDPYSHRHKYTMPKLILLGANDPYWVVDSLRHYWADLPEPKLIHQTPNAGHGLAGGDAMLPTLAMFYQRIADREALPSLSWNYDAGHDGLKMNVATSEPFVGANRWRANSPTRDFREREWSRESLNVGGGGTNVVVELPDGPHPYQAFLGEVEFKGKGGERFSLTTEVKVTPDDLSEARRPASGEEMKFWLTNMMGPHRYTVNEVRAATGMTAAEIRAARERLGLANLKSKARAANAPLLALPYPGGRHPRIGFLDGAVAPKRETKISVFAPWDDESYVVADIPEAIWWNRSSPETQDRKGRELLYLAHTHVPTYWTRRSVDLEHLEWQRDGEHGWRMERELPNGVTFGASLKSYPDRVEMEQWLKNGTKITLTGLRVQNCVMLKGAKGFDERDNANKMLSNPYAAVRSSTGDRWVITAWDPCVRPWANARCPCLHSDPQFPDVPPGETRRLKGWLSFYEGKDIDAEIKRIDASGWRSR
jgi:PhoPQ-activated pathogenicity-related protein